jgi:magnesium-transporting ATPase (P-type)
VLRRGVVFARMSPSQKTNLIRSLKEHLGHNVLMCGDGANDVGALREADTGVALAATDEQEFVEDLEEIVVSSSMDNTGDDTLRESSTSASRLGVEHHGRDREEDSAPGSAVLEMQETQQAASLAASFTSYGSSIKGTLEVIRQGRAAAAASLAAFQYMFLYSVIQFSSVMLLYSRGALVADGQFLFVDLFLVMPLAVLMSRLDAARHLHDKRPSKLHSNVLCFSSSSLTFRRRGIASGTGLEN